MTYAWPKPQEIDEPPERPAVLSYAAEDDPAWVEMPGDDPIIPLPEPPEVQRARAAQAALEQAYIEEQERRRRFIEEYLWDGDMVMAAARAGYLMVNETVAAGLLTVPEIARAIRERLDAWTPEDKRAWAERKLWSEARSYGKAKMPIAVIKALAEFAKFAGVSPEEKGKGETTVHLHISQDDANL